MEALESRPDIGMVVDADHDPALAAPHEIGHLQVLLEGEGNAVALCLPVRWVHVVKGVRPIVALDAIKPGQVLHIHPSKPLPGRGQVLFDTQDVRRRPSGRRAERLPRHFAAKGMMLQVEEARSALDIGEG